MSALGPDPVATEGTVSAPLLAALRASAGRLDPDRVEFYGNAGPELWQRAADEVSALLVLCVRYRRRDLEGAEFRRQVARLLHRVEGADLVASLAWQLQTFSLLLAQDVPAFRPQDELDEPATADPKGE